MDYRIAALAILVTLFIVYISSLPGRLFWGHESLTEQIIYNFSHIPEYALLTLLWLKAFTGTRFKERHVIVNGFVLAGLALFAISDEIHQSFVPGRSASFVDLGLDCLGILLGLSVNKASGRFAIFRAR